nr:PE-PGRS family protein PE_PGRS16-like [Setaria viridis]
MDGGGEEFAEGVAVEDCGKEVAARGGLDPDLGQGRREMDGGHGGKEMDGGGEEFEEGVAVEDCGKELAARGRLDPDLGQGRREMDGGDGGREMDGADEDFAEGLAVEECGDGVAALESSRSGRRGGEGGVCARGWRRGGRGRGGVSEENGVREEF